MTWPLSAGPFCNPLIFGHFFLFFGIFFVLLGPNSGWGILYFCFTTFLYFRVQGFFGRFTRPEGLQPEKLRESLKVIYRLAGYFIWQGFFGIWESPLNGHRQMATAKWPRNNQQKALRSFSHFFACFRVFLLVFDRCCTFSLVFALFGLSVSDRFWPSVFPLFCTIRVLPFSGHLDSSD